ncbi:putative export associated protein [Actinacidiphila reveromycinica]|uniref:Putative export associated protein n=1 Tax=Actinacidiphila reveromycinica TaxID=659352 RepID=A0A7U3UQ85_9ACTN|nr:TerD family protein [Streptomyces sp. SN-593]BBA96661.1 putative export associated protein [Streptomyces sp. SN-593]
MTAELVRGQNHPLPGNRLEIRVSAGTPVVAAATFGDERGRAVGPDGGGPSPDREWLAHPGAPQLPGVEVPRQAAAEHRLAVDLGAVPQPVHRVHVLLALPADRAGAPADFGATPAPHVAVTTPDGTAVADYTVTGLGAETALLALELYRRQGAWKVRAVGQGYADGLSALLLDQGVPDADAAADEIHAAVRRERSRSVDAPAPRDDAPAPRADVPAPRADEAAGPADPGTTGAASGAPDTGGEPPAPAVDYRHPRRRAAPAAPPVPPAPPSGDTPGPPQDDAPRYAPPPEAPAPADGPPAPVAGDAGGWTMEERLHNQIWGMFEDLARTVAAYRSAEDFAQSRYDQEMDALLADPRTRGGAQAEAARDQAMTKRVALVDQARAVLDRDLAQLAAEADVVEPALPPAFAGWENPAWHAYQVPERPAIAVRLGGLTVPEAPELSIPLLVRLPLERGLWVDSADERGRALETAAAVAARLVACHPAGGFAVHVLDPAGSAAGALAPLYSGGVVALPPPAAGAAGVSEVLGRLTARVDLLQMAMRGGAADALPPGFDQAEQLLIVNEFPYGFDDRAVNQLRYLADEGPAAGVHLLLVADRDDASAYGPVLDVLWRSMLRLTPLPSDHLADPWVGHAWTYEPALVPPGSQVVAQVLRRLAAARPAYGM